MKFTKKTPLATIKKQGGLSLLELLVGITIGLFVALAAIGSLIYTKTASTSVGDAARLQQDATTIMRSIGSQIKQAGSRRIENATNGEDAEKNENVQFNTAYLGFSTSTFTIIKATDGSSNSTDTVSISSSRDDSIGARDCLGTLPENTQTSVISEYALVGNQIRCTGVSTAAPMIEGVEDLQVWYGIQSNDNMRYVTASQVSDWNRIVSMMVCIRMAGETRVADAAIAATVGCNGESVVADGRIRRTFRQVFSLRNNGL